VAGIDKTQIKECAKTGLIVDITGTGPISPGASVKAIALRADIDGLKMAEVNPALAYASRTEYAHMCGHDGHTASLILAAYLLQRQRERLPADSKVRLLFQPAEEGPGGALPMVLEGCLETIDEVYGMHNMPNTAAGHIRVKAGPMMAAICGLKIVIKG
jgi:hippurate hydrolase